MSSTYDTMSEVNRDLHQRLLDAFKGVVGFQNSVKGTPVVPAMAALQLNETNREVAEWLIQQMLTDSQVMLLTEKLRRGVFSRVER